jgi:ATP synthase mitochondrial F1 complex assembly factor 2
MSLLSLVRKLKCPDKEARIFKRGLDMAGKTTNLKKLFATTSTQKLCSAWPIAQKSQRNHFSTFQGTMLLNNNSGTAQEVMKSFSGAQVAPAQSIRGVPKFYETATHVQDESENMWLVHLDNKPVRTPRKNLIKVKNEELAFAIAQEWDCQQIKIEPAIMPLTAIVCAHIDQYPECVEDVIVELKRYLMTDTICFRADEDDQKELELQQKEIWDPIIDWMSSEFDIQLGTTKTIIKPEHSENCLAQLDQVLRTLSDSELCALYSVTTVCKSLSIGMAVIKRFITVDEAVLAARTEEEYQIKLWGMVEGGHDVDRAHIRVQISSASTFLWLLNGA